MSSINKITYFDDEKNALLSNISHLNERVNNCGQVTRTQLEYLKMMSNHKLEVLQSVAVYPKLAYYYSLLEANQDSYKKLMKRELFLEKAQHLVNKTQAVSQLNQYQEEARNTELSSKRAQELEVLMIALKSTLDSEKDIIQKLQEKEKSYDSMNKEEMINELLSKFNSEELNSVYNVLSDISDSNRNRAIFNMMEEKTKSEKLFSIINKIKVNQMAKKQLKISITFPAFYCPYIDNIIGKTKESEEVIYNPDTLSDTDKKLSDLEFRLIADNAMYANLFNQVNIDNILAVSANNSKECSKLFRRNANLLNPNLISDYFSVLEEYQQLESKRFKSFTEKKLMQEVYGNLIDLANKLIEQLKDKIINHYKKLANILGLEYRVYPLNLNNIVVNYDMIMDRYVEVINHIRRIRNILNDKKIILQNQVAEKDAIHGCYIQQIANESGVDLSSRDDFNLNITECFAIYDKAYLSSLMDKFDFQISQDLGNEFGIIVNPRQYMLS